MTLKESISYFTCSKHESTFAQDFKFMHEEKGGGFHIIVISDGPNPQSSKCAKSKVETLVLLQALKAFSSLMMWKCPSFAYKAGISKGCPGAVTVPAAVTIGTIGRKEVWVFPLPTPGPCDSSLMLSIYDDIWTVAETELRQDAVELLNLAQFYGTEYLSLFSRMH